MKNKTLIGTLAGGIAFFLLGWLIYGMLLMSYLEANTNSALWRKMEDMIWWALILSNFIWAYFISMIFEWSNTNSMATGMQRGLLLGLISTLAMDIGLFSNTSYYNSLSAALVDTIAVTVMTTIVGALLGKLRSKGSEAQSEA